MNDEEIFPQLHDGSTPEEPWDHRIRPLAAILKCRDEEAWLGFNGLEFPEYITKPHLNAVREQAKLLNSAIKPTEKLLSVLRHLPQDTLFDLRQRGVVTVEQVQHLYDVITGEAEELKGWYARQKRPGGRNIAAHLIAEGVRRAFRQQRKPITFGVYDGNPGTDFCRAVKATLAGFKVQADWSEPAHGAWFKQQNIQTRLEVAKANQKRRQELFEKYPFLNSKQISIRFQGAGIPANVIALVSKQDPSSAPLLLPIKSIGSDDPATIERARLWADGLR